jgi:hypothetical protein
LTSGTVVVTGPANLRRDVVVIAIKVENTMVKLGVHSRVENTLI